MGQSAADFIAKRRAQAGKTARRTGGGGTGGGQPTRKKQLPPDEELQRTKRQAAAGLMATGQAKLNPNERAMTDEMGETSPDDIQAGFETSPTEMGIRDTREYEGAILDQLIAESEQNLATAREDLRNAELDLKESELARRRAEYGGTAEVDPDTGRLFGLPYAGSLGMFPGARDPETLKVAKEYNRRYANRLSKRGTAQGIEERLNLLKQAKDSGMSVAELKQRLFAELDDQEVERAQIQEELGLRHAADIEYGGSGQYRDRVTQQYKDDETGEWKKYSGDKPPNPKAQTRFRGGSTWPRIDELDRRKAHAEDLLSVLPQTEEFQHEVEPLSETPVDTSPPTSPAMTEDEILASFFTSPVRPDEPTGRNPNLVTNAIDPELIKGMEAEMRRNPPTAVADVHDTGRR